MSLYIVDCRYVQTTTPAGQPDFTVEIEADSPEHAMRLAEKESDAYGDFTAVEACETLALVEMLRSHVRILAAFGYEMASQSREAEANGGEFETLLTTQSIPFDPADITNP